MYNRTKTALEEAGFNAFSAINVHGRGKEAVKFTPTSTNEDKEHVDYHRFMAKKMLLLFLRDEDEERLINTIIATNRTKNSGDGKIFIIPVNESIRIRTGETNNEALV